MAKVKKRKGAKPAPKSKRTGPSSSRALGEEKLRAVTGGVIYLPTSAVCASQT
jgi:hypothetical protein